MLKKIFWSKYMSWLRRILGADRPEISFDTVLGETNSWGEQIADINTAKQWSKNRYQTFSGVDVKIWIKPSDSEWFSLPEVNSISCVHRPDGSVDGFMRVIVFDKDPIAHLPGYSSRTRYKIVLEAASEYGGVAHMRLDGVVFGERSWELSIDDLVTEMHVQFQATGCKPWTSETDDPGPRFTSEELRGLSSAELFQKVIVGRLDSR